MKVKVKYVRPIKPITQDSKGDWIDLRCAEDIRMRAGEYALIPLGVAMELPSGYEAIVAPRSSTYAKWGVIQTNGIGVIDETYRGDNDEWHFPCIALRDTVIHKNDRICQFRLIEHQPAIEIKPVGTLGNENRGGLGSTGEN